MTHTEGNWKAFTDNANGFGVTNGNTVIAIAGEDDLPENEANANLIAAAPEMLKALKNIANFYFGQYATDFQDEVYALIARAEGKDTRRK